jgi:DNA gyrase subunit A
VVTSKGAGKIMAYKNFSAKGRGGKGMHYLKVTDKVGYAVTVRSVFPEDEIIIASKSGMTIRMMAKEVSVQGRASSGVRLLTTDEGDEVSDVAILTEEK